MGQTTLRKRTNWLKSLKFQCQKYREQGYQRGPLFLSSDAKKEPQKKSRPSFYDLVDVVVETHRDALDRVDREETPLLFGLGRADIDALHAAWPISKDERAKLRPLSSEERALFKLEDREVYWKTYMLGDLAYHHRAGNEIIPIKFNSERVTDRESKTEILLAEEIIFCPIYDSFSKKYLMSDPEEAKALFALDYKDQRRYGIEVVFHFIHHQGLAENLTERKEELKEKIEELAFFCPRVPIKKGSGSFYCVLLNLENTMEELAFVRNYGTLDPFTDTVFVDSALSLMAGNLQLIPYDGQQIDSIFKPLIHWQSTGEALEYQTLTSGKNVEVGKLKEKTIEPFDDPKGPSH